MFGNDNFNSDALLQSSIGLLSGDTWENKLAGGLLGAKTGMDAQKAKQIGDLQKNQTVQMLQRDYPMLAQAVLSGNMDTKSAWAEAIKLKNQKAEFKQLDDGTYGTWDGLQFKPLGKAVKPAALPEQIQVDQYYDQNPQVAESHNNRLLAQQRVKDQYAATNDFEQRKQIAAQLGIDQKDPAYKPFLATGRFPREDQQALTAVDKKAILEADEMVQANQQAIDNLDSILAGDKGKTLNDRAGYGMMAGTQAFLARNDPTGWLDDKKGEATTELSNVVLGNALGQLKSIFGAAPTEGERKILIDLQASVDKTPVERAAIIKRARDLAQKRLDFNKDRADQLRGSTYYKPQQQNNNAGVTSNGLKFSAEPD